MGIPVKPTAAGRLICFEGIDGAGKSSVARGVCRLLVEHRVDARFVARKEPTALDSRFSPRLELLAELIWGYGELPVERLGDHHALYNVASWFAALDRIKIRPLLDAGVTVVMDNWYFKFLARLTLKDGLDAGHAAACFAHLTRPDRVFHLRVPPAVAAERKTTFNRGESGSFDGYGPPSRESFLSYQERVAPVLDAMARRHGWIAVDAAGRNLPQVVDFVFARLATPAAVPATPATA